MPRIRAFEAITEWYATEKVDGMNIQVHLAPGDPPAVQIYGRSQNAHFRPDWMSFLQNIFSTEKVRAYPCKEYTDLYGELVGPKINGNLHGLENLAFYGFDVRVGNRFLERSDIHQIFHTFGAPVAPLMSIGSALDIVATLRDKEFTSRISTNGYFEGVVCRPAYELCLPDGEWQRPGRRCVI